MCENVHLSFRQEPLRQRVVDLTRILNCGGGMIEERQGGKHGIQPAGAVARHSDSLT